MLFLLPPAVKAVPQPTEEATADVEAMIKRRIVERRFDDVVRVVPPPLEKEKRLVELDDNKSKKVWGGKGKKRGEGDEALTTLHRPSILPPGSLRRRGRPLSGPLLDPSPVVPSTVPLGP